MTWELPQEWQDAIANPEPDSLLDPAILAATVFFQEHAFIYGLERAEELQPEVEAAIARSRVELGVSVARILDGAGWTDQRLADTPSPYRFVSMSDACVVTRMPDGSSWGGVGATMADAEADARQQWETGA